MKSASDQVNSKMHEESVREICRLAQGCLREADFFEVIYRAGTELLKAADQVLAEGRTGMANRAQMQYAKNIVGASVKRLEITKAYFATEQARRKLESLIQQLKRRCHRSALVHGCDVPMLGRCYRRLVGLTFADGWHTEDARAWCFLKLHGYFMDRFTLLSQNVLCLGSDGFHLALADEKNCTISYIDPTTEAAYTLSYCAKGAGVLQLTGQTGNRPVCLLEVQYQQAADGRIVLLFLPHGDVCGHRSVPFAASNFHEICQMLDMLLEESREIPLEFPPLPYSTVKELETTKWNKRDVLVGALRRQEQLEVCLQHKFYHIPVSQISEDCLPIRYVAIYQSKTLFGQHGGVQYYGEVKRCRKVKRRKIREIPTSDEMANVPYYRLDVKEWKVLPRSIRPKEIPFVHISTNLFLLRHSQETPELLLRSEKEYRLYHRLLQAMDQVRSGGGRRTGFLWEEGRIIFQSGKILVYDKNGLRTICPIEEFDRRPVTVFEQIRDALI